VKEFGAIIQDSQTIVWNGPVGVFEMAPYSEGTRGIAQHVSQAKCVSIIGGGDTASAVQKLGLATHMTHISTGGGASLELLEGKTLPGLAVLDDA